MKFGLRNVVPITNAPHWSALRGKYGFALKAAVPPATIDYLKLLPIDSGMMANDGAGCCFWSAQGHGRQARTIETTGKMLTEPDSVILGAYSSATGYNPDDISTDNGTDPNRGFSWLTKNGLPSASGVPIQLLAAIEIDPRNIDDCLEALDLCCGLYIGAQMPQSIVSAPTPPQVWDAGPLSSEGHEIFLARANPDFTDLGIVSWGLKYQLTNAFWEKCVNQVTACIWSDWFEASRKTPFNMTPDQLSAEMVPLSAGPIP